jgi:hypothetical protein
LLFLLIDQKNKINKSLPPREDVATLPDGRTVDHNYKRRIIMAGLDKRVATYQEALAGLTDNMTVL